MSDVTPEDHCDAVHPGFRHVTYIEAVEKAGRFAVELTKKDQLIIDLERRIAQLRHDLWVRDAK